MTPLQLGRRVGDEALLDALRRCAGERGLIEYKMVSRLVGCSGDAVRARLRDPAFRRLIAAEAPELVAPVEAVTAMSARRRAERLSRITEQAGPEYNGPSEPDPEGGTTALPGSPGKLTVMARRAALGYALHHPDDARPSFGTRPDGHETVGPSLNHARPHGAAW